MRDALILLLTLVIFGGGYFALKEFMRPFDR